MDSRRHRIQSAASSVAMIALSFFALPIAILQTSKYDWDHQLQIYAGACMLMTSMCFGVAGVFLPNEVSGRQLFLVTYMQMALVLLGLSIFAITFC